MADGKVVYEITADASAYDKTIGQLTGTASGAAAKIAAAFTAAFAAVGAGLTALAVEGVKYNAQMETYLTSFETMLGSADLAAEKLAELKALGASTPFELEDLAKATQTMLSFGLSSEFASEMLQVLGDISQGDAQKLDSLTLAFSQVQSSGKLTGQDLLQMINVGFNPLNIIAQKTGESMEELRDRMSKGGVSALEVADAMRIATREGGLFFGAMEKQSKTFNGQLSTVKDNWGAFVGSLTTGLHKIAAENTLPKVNKALEELNQQATNGALGAAFDRLWESVGNLAARLIEMSTEALPGAIDGISWLIDHAEPLSKVFLTAATSVVTFKTAMAVGETIKTIKELTESLKGLGHVAGDMLINGAKNGAAAIQSLGTAISTLHPYVLLVVAAIGLLVGVVAGLNAIIEKQNEKWADFIAQAEETQAAAQKIRESIGNIRTVFEETTNKISSNADAAQKLVARLKELESITKKTAAQKREMHSIVYQLNQLVPGLNASYDEMTDSLNMSTEAMAAFIETAREQAQLDAATQAYTEALVEQSNALRVLREAEEQYASSHNQHMAAQASGNRIAVEETYGAMMLQKEAVDAAKSAYNDATDAVNYYSGALEQTAAATTEAAEATALATSSWERAAPKLAAIADAAAQAGVSANDLSQILAHLGGDVEATAQSFEAFRSKVVNVFDEIQMQSAISVEEMIANLEKNIEATTMWAENLAILAERGLNEGLLQTLRDGGPEMALVTAELVKASDTEIQKLNDVYEKAATTSVDTYIDVHKQRLPEVQEVGGAMTEATAEGMRYKQALLEGAAFDVGSAGGRVIQSGLGDGYSIGAGFVQGLAAGLKNNVHLIEEGAAVVADAFNAATSGMLGPTAGAGGLKHTRYAVGEDYVMEDWTPAYLDRGERVLTAEQNRRLMSLGGLDVLERSAGISMASRAGIGVPTQVSVIVTGAVELDGYEVGRMVLRNLDDAAAYTLKG